jgi:zinc transporter 9
MAAAQLRAMAYGSKRAVGTAIAGNAAVMLAKLLAFLLTGSAAMLSEALHSLADTLNQVLLMIGIARSSRPADRHYPFGYGAERAVWALMSAVGIFFLGCGVTLYHGVSALIHPHHVESLTWALAVLLISLVIEGYVLAVALRAARRNAAGKPLLAYLRVEADPTLVAVIMEDSAACFGVLLALAGIVLTRVTGHTGWDAVASILIGLLLGAVAVWLIVRTRHMLVGPAVPKAARERIRAILAQHPAVEKIVVLRTRMLDTETYRVTAELEFAGDALAAKLEDRLRELYPEIRTFEDFRAFAARYADDVVELLGDEVDAIEEAIRSEVPEARYLDIETE